MEKRLETILSLQLPYRDQLVVQRSVYRGGDGPRAAVVAGMHGDELEGLYVCHLLAAMLERYEQEHPGSLLGQVELYPAINPLGLESRMREVPLYGTDLNRNFPGHRYGLLPQRLADAVMKAVGGASLVVDVHGSNVFVRELAQVRFNSRFGGDLLPLARTLGLPVIWSLPSECILEAGLSHSLNISGVPCLVVEMGCGMRLTPDSAQQVAAGIVRGWQQIGVLSGDLPLAPPGDPPLQVDEDTLHVVNAVDAGLFVPQVAHGAWVDSGQTLGQIVSPFDGGAGVRVAAPVAGLVFSLREYPLVYEGSLLARIVVCGDKASNREGNQR